jgi:hypothetical protein
VQTTERYIGCRQKFKEAVNDRFQISLAKTARYSGFTATCREPDRIKWFDECVGLKSIVVASNPQAPFQPGRPLIMRDLD